MWKVYRQGSGAAGSQDRGLEFGLSQRRQLGETAESTISKPYRSLGYKNLGLSYCKGAIPLKATLFFIRQMKMTVKHSRFPSP
jgi:hypothetical protein